MTTSSEKLIIELKAETAGLESSLNKINKKLGNVEKSADGADKSINKFASAAKGTAAAVAAAAAALTTMIVLAGKTEKEMGNLSRTAGTTKKNFEELAFAFSQFGVDAKGTADAMNDVRERLGEFAAAGTGPFQDFADVMGLGAQEAKELATEMQHLSGEDAIGLMVSRMEDAEVPAAQLSFVMKSMSNDLEYASKAFAENGKELERLKGRYAKMNEQLSITAEEAELLAGASESFDLMTASFGKASTAISATLAPVMTQFFNDIIDVVPDATNTIIDFINSFKDAEDIKSLRQIDSQITATTEKIAKLQEQVSSRGLTDMRSGGIGFSSETLVTGESEELDAELVKLEEYVARRAEILEAGRLAEAERREGGKIGGEGGGEGVVSAELQALLDSFKTEEELRQEKFERELELLEEHEGLKKELIERYAAETEQLKLEREERELKEKEKKIKEEEKLAKKKTKAEEKELNNQLSAAKTVGNLLFEDNKAVQAGMIVADTAVNVVRSVKNNGGVPYGLPAGAAAAAMGVAQLAALNSASKGGGSVSSAGTGGSVPAQDFVDDTESVQVSGTIVTSEGTTESSVAMPNEDDMARAMWGIIKMAQDNGSIA